MRDETKEALDNIVDTIGGINGGVDFYLFLTFLREFDKRAENGDKVAEQIIDVVKRFDRLIKISIKEMKGKNDEAQ